MKKEIDFIKLIKEDKNALVNKEGLKPLFELAEAIRLETKPLTKAYVEKSLCEIEMRIFNSEELSTYLSFIYYSKLDTDTLLNKIIASLKTTFLSNTTEDSVCRGLLVRFIIERKPDIYSIQSLFKESSIREKASWIWIDCLSHYSFSLVIKEITTHINEESALKNLIVRIPTFLKKFGKDDLRIAIVEWYANIENFRSRAILDNWAKNLNIKVGMSISAEALINNVPFFQNSLMQHG